MYCMIANKFSKYNYLKLIEINALQQLYNFLTFGSKKRGLFEGGYVVLRFLK